MHAATLVVYSPPEAQPLREDAGKAEEDIMDAVPKDGGGQRGMCRGPAGGDRFFLHLYRTLWHLLLIFPILYSEGNTASMDLSGILINGDVLIGAVIPLHINKLYPTVTFQEKPPADICTMFRFEHYQQFQAMRFAVDEINRSPDLLPNVTLGFYAYDSCAVLQKELEGTLWMLSGTGQAIPNYCCRESPPLAAIIGHSSSTYSILMAHILGLYRYPQLLYYLKKVRVCFSNMKELFFNENGDPPAMYDIVNWQRHPDGSVAQVKVGSYDTVVGCNDSFTINASLVWWQHGSHEVPVSICSESCPTGFRKAPRRGEPICCFECVLCPQGEISNQTDSIDCSKCPWDMWPNNQKNRCLSKPIEYLSYDEPLGFTLASTSVSSSMVPISIFRLFLHYKNTPIVRANNYSLSCMLLVSLTFCFLSSLAFIGYPDSEKCLLRQVTFGMIFTLCVSCILAKTIMVVFAFMATKPGSSLKRWTSPQVSYMIIVCCSLLQLALCIGWVSASPPFPQMNIDTKPGIIVIECNENSPIAFWSMLGYLGLLASISFIVAFLARRLPDSFNEAKFITFSMLAFLSVWVSYIPASLSSQGKYTVAMEIFAIQSSSWALVMCMFLPKCFIILFRPHMNTKEQLLGKDRGLK